MKLEKGVVSKIPEENWAEVVVHRDTGCPYCGAAMSCGVHETGNQRKIRALNRAGAKQGDVVSMAQGSGSLLAAAAVYVVPTVLLVLGAVLGSLYGPAHGMDGNKSSMLFGAVGIATGIGLSAVLSRLIVRRAGMIPVITRILPEEHPSSCALSRHD